MPCYGGSSLIHLVGTVFLVCIKRSHKVTDSCHLSLWVFLGSFAVFGFELRAYTLSHSTSPFFVMGFFEIESHKLFSWDGFEP
jgi:hypothetical protein